ncbi:precorrin-6Y C5,15-methyltransferase (decarboxylating) subunit CbiT [Clostridium sp. CX1]|uniref:Precorrin-6Y C5,15-methyltransferase (Decarboxylating) subunit CbiT n=1 Tax=Clostridium tanneri TaxID=3037988 RepID=A0ABU4JV80_9CLOT|nr:MULTISPECIES: precorrin-6Y C5,15-methyltransferase (decarboxylating) subunit CbiT [unclassified Clostridium]MCT8976626.1 precorrin-6Y C5,15-methyltransferase (decarboxylating) subunit CbiT [Clostridium sp. CX1]MDW8801839.1 precorrin-6Y C5,15-methyltransferase (decarboxylating) subunit CbiT [Clostridium sp. A1-XYC3]
MIYIKDEEFIRGDCPMTKEEVRILSTAKLELKENYRVIDIGAGTGSISIQISTMCTSGQVIAVEKDEEALRVIKLNREKFGASNLTIIEGEALAVEKDIDLLFDAIFIGGSGGNIEDIIRCYDLKLKTGHNMVLNFITIDNLYKAMNTLKGLNYEVECMQVSISKARGKSYMMASNNSIFIVTGKKQ